MASFKTGDLATLICGSPRMAVESVEGDQVSLVWCNEGVIYRDTFAAALVKKWETRDGDSRGGRPSYRGGRDDRGGGRDDFRGNRDGGRDGGHDKGKTGWNGKPREKSHFRKD